MPTSTSVRKWMASGSVTRRFLFSTNFLSLEHLWDSDAGDKPAHGDLCPPVTQQIQLCAPYLHRLSGMSSRLLLAAMNSSRLVSLPMPEGIPSKSSLLEFRYIFFSLVSLQMADWGRRRWSGEREPQQGAGMVHKDKDILVRR